MPENDDIDSVVESAYDSAKALEWGKYQASGFKTPMNTVASKEWISLFDKTSSHM